jgi:hypothetical protein
MVWFIAMFLSCFNPLIGFLILAFAGIEALLNRGNQIAAASYHQQAAMLDNMAATLQRELDAREVIEVESKQI